MGDCTRMFGCTHVPLSTSINGSRVHNTRAKAHTAVLVVEGHALVSSTGMLVPVPGRWGTFTVQETEPIDCVVVCCCAGWAVRCWQPCVY